MTKWFSRTLALLLFALPLFADTFTTNGPHSTDNDDTCDIALLPAATLLIPYFEVNPAAVGAQTTIVTVTNTSNLPHAVAMTLWTDYGYPVITFRIYLTGYDVQSINLYDIIVRGKIAPDDGTGSDVSPVGDLSGPNSNDDFDNPQLNEASCTNLPVRLPSVYIDRMMQAFTQGTIPQLGTTPACTQVGGVHANAVGYVTLDDVVVCASSLPTESAYFGNELGYDNVLTGDYLQIDGTNDYAQGSPAVHIRAIPEGGNPSTRKPTNFTNTFYSHLHPSASSTIDNRQPLPSTFAARWIEGGSGGFSTFYKIWREVPTARDAACNAYRVNADMPITEIVRFDEEENPETAVNTTIADPPINRQDLPATALVASDTDEVMPVNSGEAVGGWMYFNLDDGLGNSTAKQNWVVVSMRAEDRFSADTDAVALGNGCTPARGASNATVAKAPPIGPAANENP